MRNPFGTNSGSFREEMSNRLEQGPEINMKDEARLGLPILCVQQVLISAYKSYETYATFLFEPNVWFSQM